MRQYSTYQKTRIDSDKNENGPASKILAIVRRVAAKPVDPEPDESLFESGLLDSFSLLTWFPRSEHEFSIRIPDSDLNPRKFDLYRTHPKYLEK